MGPVDVTKKAVAKKPVSKPTLTTKIAVKLMHRHAQGKRPKFAQRWVLQVASRRLNMGNRTRTGTTDAGAKNVEKP